MADHCDKLENLEDWTQPEVAKQALAAMEKEFLVVSIELRQLIKAKDDRPDLKKTGS